MPVSAIEFSDLAVAYGTGRYALHGVTLTVPAETMVAVLGPNGGGKTTLLKVILGLVRPERGRVDIAGQGAGRRARRLVGYVPQRDDVDPAFPVTVFDVALMGRVPALTLFRRLSRRDRQLAWEALATVGMGHHARARIGELSGGQQQRVFLARALAGQAQVLLLDEPVTGVDTPSQHEIFALLRRLRDMGKTILITSHDLNFVGEHADLALLLASRVVAFGRSHDVLVPHLFEQAYGNPLTRAHGVDAMATVTEAGNRG